MNSNLDKVIIKICSILNKHGVKYLIVGGTAVALHGYFRASVNQAGLLSDKPGLDLWYNPGYDKSLPFINKIKNYATEVIAGRKEIRRLSKEAERGRKEGGIRNVEATVIFETGNGRNGKVEGREAQQQIIEDYAKSEMIWHDNIELDPNVGTRRDGLGDYADSGIENTK